MTKAKMGRGAAASTDVWSAGLRGGRIGLGLCEVIRLMNAPLLPQLAAAGGFDPPRF